MLDVFIISVFKSVLIVVSVLGESFCFTGVMFSSVVFRNRFLTCGLIMFLHYLTVFESWFINKFMMISLFLSWSLRSDICSSTWFINVSQISLFKFLWTCSLGLCLAHDCKKLIFKAFNFCQKLTFWIPGFFQDL